MEETKTSLVKGVVIYLIAIQVYRLCQNAGNFVFLKTSSSTVVAGVLLVLSVLASLLTFRLLAKKYSIDVTASIKPLYLYLIGVSILARVVIPLIGEKVGQLGTGDDYHLVITYFNAESWAFMAVNILIVFLYRPLLK